MYKQIFLLIVMALLALSTTSCAQTEKQCIELNNTSRQTELHKLFFWRVKSRVSVVYILGSIHVGKKDMFPLSEMIEVAFDASDTLVVEIDPEKIDAKEVKKYFEYSGDDGLRNHISESLYNRLVFSFSRFGIPEIKYYKMKPAAVVTSLVMVKLASMGYDPEFGIDKYYLDDARGKKEIQQIETAEQQLKLMDELGEDYIEYTLQDISRWDKEIKMLINAWSTGNTEMVGSFFERCANYPGGEKFLKKFIYDRNKIMFEKIENCLKCEGRYFVVVGAGHLVGKNGIISMLKNTEKYQVVQLSDFNQ